MPNISLARRFRLSGLLWRLAALAFLLLMTAVAHAQSREPAIQAINAFENATHDYVLDILPYALIDMTARNSRPQGDVR